MTKSTLDNPETVTLARVIGQNEATLPPDVAQEFLRWTFTESDLERMNELAEKARACALTPQEQAEAEGYERVSSFLGIVKSKARWSLQTAAE